MSNNRNGGNKMCDTNSNHPQLPEHEGYVVILNTLAKFYSDTREDLYEYCNKITDKAKNEKNPDYKTFHEHFESYLTFGDFDRLSFCSIDRFSKYYDLDFRSKYWLGKHQNVFLYCIKGCNIRYSLYPYSWNNQNNLHEFGLCVKDNEDSDKSFRVSALTGDVITAKGKTNLFFPFFFY